MPLELLVLEHYCAWLIAGPEGAALWFALRLATGEGRPSAEGRLVELAGIDGFPWQVELLDILVFSSQVVWGLFTAVFWLVAGCMLLLKLAGQLP